MQTIRPRDGDVFMGETGTVLSGARPLTTFTRDGGYWVARGQTQQGVREGSCQAGYARCNYPEDVFVDDQLLQHVDSLAALGPGRWFFDYDADRIYLNDDPTGRQVETSVTPAAFEATGSRVAGVTISNLTIEKYANPGNTGAIWAPNSINWTISHNEIRWNHAGGIACGSGARILDNNVHHNGQVGLGGYNAADVLVEHNELAHNNTVRFDPFWGAGGLKMVAASRLVVRGNVAHHNGGPGLWCDFDCVNALFEQNTVDDNEHAGIVYEISFSAVIRNNVIRRNGFGVKEGPAQAGIFVAAAKDVSVYDNTLVDNASGIVAYQENRGTSATHRQRYEIENLNVYNNSITMEVGINGLVQRVRDPTYYTSRNNRFARNRYRLGAGGRYFTWMDAVRSESEWRAYGQDRTGTFAR